MMKTTSAILCLALALMIVGCGVNKDYVAEQIADSEGRTGAKIATVQDKADGNAAEVAKLQALAKELAAKTDMAINKAKGFEAYQVLWSGVINFDFDSWDITPTAEQILSEACQKMTEVPGSVIEIEGHTDQTGSNKYNLMLGEKRAGAAKRHLADNCGVSLYRMFLISYGEDKPVAMGDERDASSKNRRVSLKVWGNPM
jgi:outer membrane protein OmpA-like peptidoglycan-associated protein